MASLGRPTSIILSLGMQKNTESLGMPKYAKFGYAETCQVLVRRNTHTKYFSIITYNRNIQRNFMTGLPVFYRNKSAYVDETTENCSLLGSLAEPQLCAYYEQVPGPVPTRSIRE